MTIELDVRDKIHGALIIVLYCALARHLCWPCSVQQHTSDHHGEVLAPKSLEICDAADIFVIAHSTVGHSQDIQGEKESG